MKSVPTSETDAIKCHGVGTDSLEEEAAVQATVVFNGLSAIRQ